MVAMTKFSSKLDEKLSFALSISPPITEALRNHSSLRALYPEYLITLHSMMRASVPLMEAASREARKRLDPALSLPLVRYLDCHIAEESGHDEWLVEDLSWLNITREQITSRQPSAAAAAMVGSQYYWIYHYNPLAILGYMSALEWYPMSEAIIRNIQSKCALPLESFNTLLKHAELDPHHKQDLEVLLDILPLSKSDEEAISVSGLHTIGCAAEVLCDLLNRN